MKTHIQAEEVCQCPSRWRIGPCGFEGRGAITLLSISSAIGGIIRQVRARPAFPPPPSLSHTHTHTHKRKHPSPRLVGLLHLNCLGAESEEIVCVFVCVSWLFQAQWRERVCQWPPVGQLSGSHFRLAFPRRHNSSSSIYLSIHPSTHLTEPLSA